MYWDYWRFLSIISLAGFVGLLFDQMLICLFVASFCYALWLQQSWYKLWFWLQKPKKNPPPSSEGVIDDICRQIERVRLQNKSRKNRLGRYLKRFQSATSALPDGIVILGEYGEVEWANSSANRLLGIRWPRDSQIRVNNLIRDPEFQVLLNEPIREHHYITLPSPLGQETQLEMQLVSYMGNGRMLIVQDITQTVKLQQMRRDFVANVSHELRTPLTVLRGYLESFTNDMPVEYWSKALPVMREQSERMDVMIQDLLALSKLETSQNSVQLTPVDLSVLLELIIYDAQKLKHYRGHLLELELGSEQMLLGESEELRSAISNLVFNAVKYTPEKTLIKISWQVNQEGATLSVEDQGEGIAHHHLERLTERFYRVDSGRDQETGGTGLGLAIVKHILQRHEGELHITSELGRGSTFSCHFPLHRVIEAKK